MLILNFVSGGTAGCVLAARLTEQDPNVRVLLLEAGEGNVQICSPRSFLSNTLFMKHFLLID